MILPPALTVPLAIVVFMALAYTIECVTYGTRRATLTTTIGMPILLQNVAIVIWGRQ